MKYNAVFCINLHRRPEQWARFTEGYPADVLGPVTRWEAVDGMKFYPPAWWKAGRGAWGCYLSHLQILTHCIQHGIESVLIFEDDAVFCDGFCEKLDAFEKSLPEKAQWVYYGGQHLFTRVHPPERVNDFVYRPYNVNRTHAYGVRGLEAMKRIVQHLTRNDWRPAHHIDHHFGRLHASRALETYCPAEWLVYQSGGISDVANREKEEIHWRDAETFYPEARYPLTLILGTHSSGSSCLAGMMWHLGFHLGNRLIGAYGTPPIMGGEAARLHSLFSRALPVPETEWRIPYPAVLAELRKFTAEKLKEGVIRNMPVALKYPQLCAVGTDLLTLHPETRIISISRPLEHSVKSLCRRFPELPTEAVEAHQKHLDRARETVLNAAPVEHVLRLSYAELLSNPAGAVAEICSFSGINPDPSQVSAAISYPDGGKCHIPFDTI